MTTPAPLSNENNPTADQGASGETVPDLVMVALAEARLPEPVKALLLGVLGTVETPVASSAGRVYLREVAVAGYRGVGNRAHFKLVPRPGVNLFVGRNGSGKSSLAEAIETAFTGTNARWNRQDQARRGGWRNLHAQRAGTQPTVELRLAVDGDPGFGTLTRSWADDTFEASVGELRRPGHSRTPADQAPWAGALDEYRPFLSYLDLDQMISGTQAKLYDAVHRILGLGYLNAVDDRLRAEESRLKAAAKAVDDAVPVLYEALSELPDEDRALAAMETLDPQRRTPDLAALDEVLANLPTADDGQLTELRRLAELRGPDPAAVAAAADRVRAALAAVEEVRATDAELAFHRADLLERAVGHRQLHAGDSSCPVCGTAGVLDDAWAARVADEVAALRGEGRAAREARGTLAAAERDLRGLVVVPPDLPAAVADDWATWADCQRIPQAAELADRAPGVAGALSVACATASQQAAVKLAARDDRWRPLYARLSTWTEEARAAEQARPRLRDLRKARDWLKTVTKQLRDQRMDAFGSQAQAIWEQLRQESNISLNEVRLDGSEKATVRRLVMDVSVDDERASALAVMSQGEQHSLALSLFLPRARTADSPFGFLLIDDPVQSMDPAKVNGLAQVLHDLGRDRQVLVFSHDTRLRRAFTSQGLSVTVFEVERGPSSHVTVKRAKDPVEQALDDARAIALTDNLPQEARRHVLPGLCRQALENAFLEAAWIRHHRDNLPEHELLTTIAGSDRLLPLAALALFGDATRSKADVEAELARLGRGWPDVQLVRDCQAGAHAAGAAIADPRRFVYRVADLAEIVRRPQAASA